MHSKTVIFEMKAHFLDYVSPCENVHNPIVAPTSSTIQEVYIYSGDEVASTAVMLEQQNNMYMNERVAQEFRKFWADVKASGTVNDVLGWYQEIKLQFTILARFATMIFDIPTSQTENERDFSLASVFTGYNRTRMLVYMLSKCIFINRNSIGIQINKITDVFLGPVEDLYKVIEKWRNNLNLKQFMTTMNTILLIFFARKCFITYYQQV